MNILIQKLMPASSYLFLPFWYFCLYSYLCCLIILIVFKFIFVRPRSGRSRHQLLAAAQVLSQVCPLHLLCNATSNIICICICVLSKAEPTLCILCATQQQILLVIVFVNIFVFCPKPSLSSASSVQCSFK